MTSPQRGEKAFFIGGPDWQEKEEEERLLGNLPSFFGQAFACDPLPTILQIFSTSLKIRQGN
jgi:hypothetical protein